MFDKPIINLKIAAPFIKDQHISDIGENKTPAFNPFSMLTNQIKEVV